jgi:uncharacterized membrane protein
MKPTMLTSQPFIVFLVVLGVALLFVYARFYRSEARQARRLTPRQKRTLWILRVLVAGLGLLALARPAVTLVHTTRRLPAVAMIVDESLSMDFPDTLENPMVQARPRDRRTRYDTMQEAVNTLQEPLTLSHRVRVFTFSDMLRLLREMPYRENRSQAPMTRDELFTKAAEPTGEYSNVGDSIVATLRNLSDERISGIVLLSDGRQTSGASLEVAAEQAARANVPVHTVVFGTEHPLRDLGIEDVLVEAEASLGDVLIFDLKIVNQIQDQLVTTLTLTEEGEQVASRRVQLRRGENRVPIATVPEVEGIREFKVSLPIQPDEVNLENNEASVHVKVVRRSLRVILIAGEPTREYYYLVPALLRDPVLELSTWLQNADVDYVQQGNVTLSRLPEDLADWQRYDVCILFDADPNKITTQQITGIDDMVRRGGGLLIMAGRNHGMAKFVQVHAVRMRNLLPVEVDRNLMPNYFQVFDRERAVRRTTIGRDHPIMLASSHEEDNEKIWATFPKFYWHAPVERVKPDAITLLETEPSADGGGLAADTVPLMVIQRYGEGAVFYSGINSLWRWRFPFETFDYDRLWTRAIRYLGETRLKGSQQQVALDTERNTYSPGENVLVRLRVLDPALMAQLRGVPLFASVTTPQKDEQMIPLQPDSGGRMLYTGHYRARRTGSTVVRCTQAAPGADSEARPIFDVSHVFRVHMQSMEHRDTSADVEGMRALAEKTGGKYFDYRNMQDLRSLVDEIPTEFQVLRRSVMVEVWDGIGFLFLFLFLVGAEWSLRKWWGLL